jgi:hypothetical protein
VLSLLLVSTAYAKDINLPLNDQEQAALRQILDIATKAGGLEIAPATIHFAEKIKTYQLQAEKPVPPGGQ